MSGLMNRDTYNGGSVTRGFLALGLLLGLAACAAPIPKTAAPVKAFLVGTSTIKYRGELLDVSAFAKRVKKDGYRMGHTVRLEVPESIGSSQLYVVKKEIQSAGYAVIMHRPKKVVSGTVKGKKSVATQDLILKKPRVVKDPR